MLNLLVIGAIVWIALIAFAVALCRAAARGDLVEQREPAELRPEPREAPRRGLVSPRDGALHGL